MAKVTAKPHPQPMSNQSPLASKIFVPRPDWLRAATAIATTPSPKQMRMNVPMHSAASSPAVVARHPARFRRGCAAAAMAIPPGSTTGPKLDGPPRADQRDGRNSDRSASKESDRGNHMPQSLKTQQVISVRHPSGLLPLASLPGPSRRITVEPIRLPTHAPPPAVPQQPERVPERERP